MRYLYTAVAGFSLVALVVAPATAADQKAKSSEAPKSGSSVDVKGGVKSDVKTPAGDVKTDMKTQGGATTDSPSASPSTDVKTDVKTEGSVTTDKPAETDKDQDKEKK